MLTGVMLNMADDRWQLTSDLKPSTVILCNDVGLMVDVTDLEIRTHLRRSLSIEISNIMDICGIINTLY